MANQVRKYQLKRPEAIRLMVSGTELKELTDAANEMGLPLSVYIRVKMLELIRRARAA